MGNNRESVDEGEGEARRCRHKGKSDEWCCLYAMRYGPGLLEVDESGVVVGRAKKPVRAPVDGFEGNGKSSKSIRLFPPIAFLWSFGS